ncbi:AAA family ATPase [Pseudodesulfovibrio pelocollis]|uniref:AAA family ATPase n=1 Tax=Pseudodesulfovibrio pelocollis TaxID=3051432 RepID=UPI00255B39FB|nr:ATP-binding protein [Pseudodesulfovibrio sp. SB368]
MRNPFILKALPPDRPFCDRTAELEELTGHARGGVDVVLSSPRRYGKTSLVFRVLAQLQDEGFLTIYTSFDQVDSSESAAKTLAQGIAAAIQRNEKGLDKAIRWAKNVLTSFQPAVTIDQDGNPVFTVAPKQGASGLELLEQTMQDLETMASKLDEKVVLVFDEFQEVTRLPNSEGVEGLLRTRVQTQLFSHFFVGSRRSVLEAMFTNRGRPFFKSALMMSLPPLPLDELAGYFKALFADGKDCPDDVAEFLAFRSKGYGFYAQQLGFYAFSLADKAATLEEAQRAYALVVEQAAPGFEMVVSSLTLNQIKLLKALATAPSREMTGGEYLARHGLVASNVAYARKGLVEQDLIEKGPDGNWRLTDPFFAEWLI